MGWGVEHPEEGGEEADDYGSSGGSAVVYFVGLRSEGDAGDLVKERADGGIEGGLEEANGEGVESTGDGINGGEAKGVAWEAVEGLVIGPLAVGDAECPVAVKLHVIAIGDEVGRMREANENEKAGCKNDEEDREGGKSGVTGEGREGESHGKRGDLRRKRCFYDNYRQFQ